MRIGQPAVIAGQVGHPGFRMLLLAILLIELVRADQPAQVAAIAIHRPQLDFVISIRKIAKRALEGDHLSIRGEAKASSVPGIRDLLPGVPLSFLPGPDIPIADEADLQRFRPGGDACWRCGFVQTGDRRRGRLNGRGDGLGRGEEPQRSQQILVSRAVVDGVVAVVIDADDPAALRNQRFIADRPGSAFILERRPALEHVLIFDLRAEENHRLGGALAHLGESPQCAVNQSTRGRCSGFS